MSTAGTWVGMYYAAITAGRFLTGLISERVGNRAMVRLGLGVALTGAVLLCLDCGAGAVLPGLLLIGVGCAPIYPCLMHETPRRFDPPTARSLVGFQVGATCIGCAALPPTVGLLAAHSGLAAIPLAVAALLLAVLALTEALNALT